MRKTFTNAGMLSAKMATSDGQVYVQDEKLRAEQLTKAEAKRLKRLTRNLAAAKPNRHNHKETV